MRTTNADRVAAGMTSVAPAPRLYAPPPENLTGEAAARAAAGSEWPVSSRLAKVALGAAVFTVGIAAGAGIAMWIAPPL